MPVLESNQNNQSSQQTSSSLNGVEAEVLNYLSKYPHTQDATTDLLELIHRLSDPYSICQTRQLPRTARSMWKRFHKPDLNQAGIKIDTLTAADGVVEEQFPHFTLSSVISELLEDSFAREPNSLCLEPVGGLETQQNNYLIVDEMDDYGEQLKPSRHHDRRTPMEEPERCYGEIHTAEWWKSAQLCFAHKFENVQTQGRHALLGVILYIDGIAVDFFGKIGLVPIMLTISNLPLKSREGTPGKRLVGFIPCLSKNEIKQRTKKDPGMVKRELMHQALSIVLHEMEHLYLDGLQVQLCDVSTVHPALAFVACDNKEAATLMNIKSGQTNCPCRICECDLRTMQLDFNRLLSNDPLRSWNAAEIAIAARNKDYIRKRSLHTDVQSAFVLHPTILGADRDRVYQLCPPDMLHTVLGGTVRLTVQWVLDIIKGYGGDKLVLEIHNAMLTFRAGTPVDAIFHFDLPWLGIAHLVSKSPGPGSRKRKQSTTNSDSRSGRAPAATAASKFNTSSWISILVALGALLGTSHISQYVPARDEIGNIEDVAIRCVFDVIDLYFRLNAQYFTEPTVRMLESTIIPNTLNSVQALFCMRQQMLDSFSGFGGIKIHLLNHFPDFIRQYGAPANWDTAHFESAHKHLVKNYFKRGSKRVQNLDCDILLKHAFWSQLKSTIPISDINHTKLPESGIRNEIRQWHVCGDVQSHDYVEYRFMSRGFDMIVRENGNRRLECIMTTFQDFNPHKTAEKYMGELLQQYLDQIEAGPDRHGPGQFEVNWTNIRHVKATLHSEIQVSGAGNFLGYDKFSLHATSHYGKPGYRRPRYDVIEVAIPSEAGGSIASSRELLRTSDDAALARLLAIVSLNHGQNTCLLLVNFLARSSKTSGQRRINKLAAKYPGIMYGVAKHSWIALYPIICFKRPVFSLADTSTDSGCIIFTLSFLSRSGWDNAVAGSDLDNNIYIEQRRRIEHSQHLQNCKLSDGIQNLGANEYCDSSERDYDSESELEED